MTNSITRLISAFVELQMRLLDSFKEAYPDISDWKFLIDAPKQGSINLQGEYWLFRRHGAGLTFKSWDGITIDVHKNLSMPDGVDSWRLIQYFESLAADNELPSESELAVDMEKLCETGALIATEKSGFYRAKI